MENLKRNISDRAMVAVTIANSIAELNSAIDIIEKEISGYEATDLTIFPEEVRAKKQEILDGVLFALHQNRKVLRAEKQRICSTYVPYQK